MPPGRSWHGASGRRLPRCAGTDARALSDLIGRQPQPARGAQRCLEMSLTSHLEASRSPVRAFFEQRFTQTRALATAANREIARRHPDGCPVPSLRPGDGAYSGTVGTAVDYLLRACLAPGALDDTVATRGVGWLDGELYRLRWQAPGCACDIEREIAARAGTLAPWERELDEPAWQSLCKWCVLLARFEQCARAPHVF